MRRWFKRKSKATGGTVDDAARERPPLREFVYLDEVSVRSLLASQKGELTDQITQLLSQADEAELAGTIGVATPVLKSEVRSRIQTSTSEGTQTSRKAVVQSLFKELRELEWINVAVQPARDAETFDSVEALISASTAANELQRGTLVEIEVELVADPIYRFSTIASVFTEMATDFPEMLNQPGVREGMEMLVPGNRLLQRFLAGLVPLAAQSTSHAVIEHSGIEYVVPKDAATSLNLEVRPLLVVGVTEAGSYWRDARRVLFSGSRFTMLCRVAQAGLANDWAPVKLAEVLKEVLPTFPTQLADVGRTGLNATRSASPAAAPPLPAALEEFITLAETSAPLEVNPAASSAARRTARLIPAEAGSTVSGQNDAFRAVIDVLEVGGQPRSGDEWLVLTQQAREAAGLTLFAEASTITPTDDELPGAHRLLDTEVIAIYW